MKQFIYSSILFFCVSAVYAETNSTTAPENTNTPKQSESTLSKSESLKNQLIPILEIQLEKLDDEGTSKEKRQLQFLLHTLNSQSKRSSMTQFKMWLRAAPLPKEADELCQQYIKQLKLDEETAINEMLSGGKIALKKAMTATTQEEITNIRKDFKQLSLNFNERKNQSAVNYRSKINNLNSSFDHFQKLLGISENSSWSGIASQIKQISHTLRDLDDFVSKDEVSRYLKTLRVQYKLPKPEDLPKLQKTLISDLFADSKQDELDQILCRINNFQSLVSSSSSIYYNKKTSSEWRTLKSMAANFEEAVHLVKTGKVSTFSPERWQREASMRALIPQQDLVTYLQNYKVEMVDANGKSKEAFMYYDIEKPMEQIKTIADISTQLPMIKKAKIFLSRNSSGTQWTQTIASLEYIQSIRDKLATGKSFTLNLANSNYSQHQRYSPLKEEHPAANKLKALHEELQRVLIQRFFPEISITETTPVPQVFETQLEKLKKSHHYEEIITLYSLSNFISPTEPLVSPQEMIAINYYLSGLRQDNELSTPRLATYYYQKSAAIQSNIIPIKDLKAKLDRLKKEFPEDYDKGTDDLFKAAPDRAGLLSMRGKSLLVVPASK